LSFDFPKLFRTKRQFTCEQLMTDSSGEWVGSVVVRQWPGGVTFARKKHFNTRLSVSKSVEKESSSCSGGGGRSKGCSGEGNYDGEVKWVSMLGTSQRSGAHRLNGW